MYINTFSNLLSWVSLLFWLGQGQRPLQAVHLFIGYLWAKRGQRSRKVKKRKKKLLNFSLKKSNKTKNFEKEKKVGEKKASLFFLFFCLLKVEERHLPPSCHETIIGHFSHFPSVPSLVALLSWNLIFFLNFPSEFHVNVYIYTSMCKENALLMSFNVEFWKLEAA